MVIAKIRWINRDFTPLRPFGRLCYQFNIYFTDFADNFLAYQPIDNIICCLASLILLRKSSWITVIKNTFMIRLPHCFLLIACSLAGCVTAKPIAPESRTSPVDSAMCDRMKARHVLTQGAPVDCDQLRIVRFPYIDFDGRTHDDGAIMVMAAATTHVEAIFNTLYQRRFPIAQARLMDHYLGDDAASMQHNNTSAFNHRPITGGNARSLHSYGLAIDLNPIQNPYVQFNNQGQASYSPVAGSSYANRLNPRPAKPVRPGMAEEVVQVFADNGFLISWETEATILPRVANL